jgi:hypothetical protein
MNVAKTTDLVKKDFFTSLDFWDKLGREDQHTIERETRGLHAAQAGAMQSRIAIGEHLTNLQSVLEGKGLFVKYLNSLNFTYRTAYRYIGAYKVVKEQIPDYALRLAAARGVDLVGYSEREPFGRYTESIKQLPPPADADKVPAWLDQIEERRKKQPKGTGGHRRRSASPEALLKEAYRSVTAAFKRLPGGKGRVVWGKRLIGMLLVEFHLPANSAEPEAVPEGFKAQVGRPKKQTMSAA